MSKINLLTVIFIFSLLSACGFNTTTATLNASITGNSDGVFATELKKHFDTKATQFLTVKIGDEIQKERDFAYSGGDASSQMLTLGVPIKISRDEKLLLSKTLTASTVVSELSISQANRLQTDAVFVQLRSEIIARLLRRLKALK